MFIRTEDVKITRIKTKEVKIDLKIIKSEDSRSSHTKTEVTLISVIIHAHYKYTFFTNATVQRLFISATIFLTKTVAV